MHYYNLYLCNCSFICVDIDYFSRLLFVTILPFIPTLFIRATKIIYVQLLFQIASFFLSQQLTGNYELLTVTTVTVTFNFKIK